MIGQAVNRAVAGSGAQPISLNEENRTNRQSEQGSAQWSRVANNFTARLGVAVGDRGFDYLSGLFNTRAQNTTNALSNPPIQSANTREGMAVQIMDSGFGQFSGLFNTCTRNTTSALSSLPIQIANSEEERAVQEVVNLFSHEDYKITANRAWLVISNDQLLQKINSQSELWLQFSERAMLSAIQVMPNLIPVSNFQKIFVENREIREAFIKNFFIIEKCTFDLQKTSSKLKRIGLMLVCITAGYISLLSGDTEGYIFFTKNACNYMEPSEVETKYSVMGCLINAYSLLRQYQKAEALFKKVDFSQITSDTIKSQIYNSMSSHYVILCDYPSALGYTMLAGRYDKNYLDSNKYQEEVKRLEHLNAEKQEAGKKLDRLLQVNPQGEDTLLQLYSCYLILGKDKDTLEVLKKLINVAPSNACWYFSMMGDRHKYLREYETAIKYYRDSTSLVDNYAMSLVTSEDLFYNIEECKRSSKLKENPTNPFLLDIKGKIKALGNNKRAAEAELLHPTPKTYRADRNQSSVVNEYPWYSCDDLTKLINLKIRSLGGFRPNSSYLLSRQFVDAYDKQNYTVLVTDAVDTNGRIPIGFFIDINQQQAPDEGRADARRDIFHEMDGLRRNDQRCGIKILFPYNITQTHWLTGEIRIHKDGSSFKMELAAHDPYGEGKMGDNNYRELCSILERRIKQLVANAAIQFENLTSPYRPRQNRSDGNACGPITVEDIFKRVEGKSLNVESPYPVGAKVLRDAHIKMIKDHYPNGDAARKIFLERHESAGCMSNPIGITVDSSTRNSQISRNLGNVAAVRYAFFSTPESVPTEQENEIAMRNKLQELIKNNDYVFSLERIDSPRRQDQLFDAFADHAFVIRFMSRDDVMELDKEIKDTLKNLSVMLRESIQAFDTSFQPKWLKPDWENWTITVYANTNASIDRIAALLERVSKPYAKEEPEEVVRCALQ